MIAHHAAPQRLFFPWKFWGGIPGSPHGCAKQHSTKILRGSRAAPPLWYQALQILAVSLSPKAGLSESEHCFQIESLGTWRAHLSFLFNNPEHCWWVESMLNVSCQPDLKVC